MNRERDFRHAKSLTLVRCQTNWKQRDNLVSDSLNRLVGARATAHHLVMAKRTIFFCGVGDGRGRDR